MSKEQLRRDELATFARSLEREDHRFETSICEACASACWRGHGRRRWRPRSSTCSAPSRASETARSRGQKLARAREAAGIEAGGLMQARRRSERILREVAHLVLCVCGESGILRRTHMDRHAPAPSNNGTPARRRRRRARPRPRSLGSSPSSASCARTALPRALVLVQLGGGNDGLATVVPHGEDALYPRARRRRAAGTVCSP